MNNKILIPIIGALSLATLGGLAYTQLSQGTKPSTKVSVNISSQQSLTSSSFPMLVSSSSQMPNSSVAIASSSVKVEEVKSQEVKVESVVKVENAKLATDQPIQDIPNVTKLSTDKSIYHQYIRDYLACPTKFYQPLNGGYIYEGLDQYQYKCIPQFEADSCPSKTLIYGFKPLVGTQIRIADGTKLPPGKLKIIEANKYYCVHFYESTGSVSMSEVSGYGWSYLPDGLDPKLPGYFVIPKTNLSSKAQFDQEKTTFAAIPLTSFSQSDQEYISKNFKVNTLPNN